MPRLARVRNICLASRYTAMQNIKMKIISQSADELVLKEGSATGIAIGIAFAIAGVFAGYRFHSANPMVIWIALAVIVIGMAVILLSSSITVSANKRSGQLLYQKKRLIGGKDSTYAIADVFRIETRRQWRIENRPPAENQGDSMPQPVLVSQSVIVFRDGRELPLDHQKTASTTSVGSVVLMGGQGAEAALASQVANFLNVPFQEIAPPNPGLGIGIAL
jgi:multisubunit Na+/H+ antiporter MnhC subunit